MEVIPIWQYASFVISLESDLNSIQTNSKQNMS